MHLKNEMSRDLAFLRKESLDIYNRVHSVAEDIVFVNQIRDHYSDNYPVVPNLRCGAWYVDPELSAGQFAYFKSTDGHFNNWSFNLRRPNLHLLSILSEKGGQVAIVSAPELLDLLANLSLILVDSTRAGKRMPDALSKMVPIWCSVINRAMCRLYPDSSDLGWDTNLYTPPTVVSPQEHHQILHRIDSWVQSLVTSSYTLPRLTLPLRPVWITPSSPNFPSVTDQAFIPIVCVSASKQIQEGLERRSDGFTYVQGSGDDHELWGMGLTPDVFWANKASILGNDRAGLTQYILELVARIPRLAAEFLRPTPISKVFGQVSVAAIADLPSTITHPLDSTPRRLLDLEDSIDTAYLIIMADSAPVGDPDSTGEFADDHYILRFSLPPSISSRSTFLLYDILPKSTSFVRHHLGLKRKICIACPDGKDLGIGVAVAMLRLFFNDDGSFSLTHPKIDKTSIRTRLQWIITSRPEANPSRSTLKRVNEFLMSHSYDSHLSAPHLCNS